MKNYTIALYFVIFFIVLIVFSESFKITQSNTIEGWAEGHRTRNRRIRREQGCTIA